MMKLYCAEVDPWGAAVLAECAVGNAVPQPFLRINAATKILAGVVQSCHRISDSGH